MGNTQQSIPQLQTYPSYSASNINKSPSQIVFSQKQSLQLTQPISQYRIDHDMLKQASITLMPSKNIMKIYLNNCNEQQLNLWMKQVKKQKYQKGVMSHQYLLMPNTIQTTSIPASSLIICGSNVNVGFVYDCYPYVLMDQIKNRRKIYQQNKYNNYQTNINHNNDSNGFTIRSISQSPNIVKGIFQQDQLWYILWAIIDAGNRLNDRGSRLGDIRPHNILFNQNGEIKIITALSWPGQLTNYHKTLYNKTQTYLSPEQLSILSTGSSTDSPLSSQILKQSQKSAVPSCNIYQSQSFSIGLTMLSLLFLQDMSKLYNRDTSSQFYGLDVIKLKSILQYIKQNITNINNNNNTNNNYSAELLDIVRRLCMVQVEQRLNYLRLWDRIKQYKYDIVNFRKFTLNTNNINNNSNSKVNNQNMHNNQQNIHDIKSTIDNNNNNQGKDKKVKGGFDTPMRILDGVLLQSGHCSPNDSHNKIQYHQLYNGGMHYHDPRVYCYPPPQYAQILPIIQHQHVPFTHQINQNGQSHGPFYQVSQFNGQFSQQNQAQAQQYQQQYQQQYNTIPSYPSFNAQTYPLSPPQSHIQKQEQSHNILNTQAYRQQNQKHNYKQNRHITPTTLQNENKKINQQSVKIHHQVQNVVINQRNTNINKIIQAQIQKTPSKYQQHRQLQKNQQEQIISRIDQTLEKSKRLFPSATKNKQQLFY